ncbi:MAG: stage II sporulation protein M [Sphingobacteriales bacterium]|nr:stage II sporulation protein M [Sphingobacteriales bacterium]
MREALFIKKNKDRWLKNQQMPPDNPDEMASEFTQLVDDLAYAKTFYPGSKVTSYINSQASNGYLRIYKNRKEESSRLVTFWRYDLPLTIYKHRRVVLFTLALKMDESITAGFLGEDYVDETKDNIAKGNPFGIYESGPPVFSWLRIMINNIKVAVLAYVLGLFAGLPTIYILAQNAAMVGAFDQFFVANGLGLQFFLVVFVHGTLELTAIIIASAAGIILGKSFLFPGTAKRIDAFKEGAKDGVKLLIGLMPIFALAAFFEGFITRLYNDLSVLTTLITSLSVVFVLWYFVILPARLGRRLATVKDEEV